MANGVQTCLCCGSASSSGTYFAQEMYRGTHIKFEYAMCADCGSLFCLSPPPQQSLYDEYYSFQLVANQPRVAIKHRLLIFFFSNFVVRFGLNRALRFAFRSPPPYAMRYVSPNLQAMLYLGARRHDKILDVGAGDGQFVRKMHEFGFVDASGIDPMLPASMESTFLRRMTLDLVTGDFNYILFNHSFEHTLTLQDDLRNARRLLKGDGCIVIHLPNVHSPEFEKYGENWWGIHAPYHTAIPSRQGLEILASRSGLTITDAVWTSRFDHYLYSEDYARNIADVDPTSIRRKLETGTFDVHKQRELASRAHQLNRSGHGDWVAYYLRAV